jgi:DNA-binding transcriptional ArsR family regulator
VEQLSKHQRIVNLPAAKYTVDLARGLGILTDHLAWSDLGHLFKTVDSTIKDPFDEVLSIPERILFFRLFLEADGSALLFIARTLTRNEVIPPKDQTWNDFANAMVLEANTDYLDLVVDLPSRTRMRQTIERRKSKPFSGKSGAHQSFIHVQALYRMGLLDKEDQGNSRRYRTGESKTPLHTLLELVPNINRLEQIIKDRTWPTLAREVFRSQLRRSIKTANALRKEDVFHELREIYGVIMETGISLCPLKTMIEALQISQIAAGKTPIEYDDAIKVLKTIQQSHPREVRFHVDRLGQPAYIKFADNLKL